jgi:hypothetical protein
MTTMTNKEVTRMMDLQPNWTDSGTPEELNKRYELPRIEPGWIEEPASTMLLIRVVERRGKAVELEWGGNRGWFFLETGSMVHPPSRGPRWCLDPIDAAELLRCASKPHEK